jgi:hypothetical protein
VEADNRCSQHSKRHNNKHKPLSHREVLLVAEEVPLVAEEEALQAEEHHPLNSKPKQQQQQLMQEEMVY